MKTTTSRLYEQDVCAPMYERTENQPTEKEQEFTRFLVYCVARLKKGDTVQAIWSGYQALID